MDGALQMLSASGLGIVIVALCWFCVAAN